MGPEEALEYGKRMRELGIAEVQFTYGPMGSQPCTARIVLLPHWTPEDKPAERPVLDSTDPVANALAQREWEEKRRAQRLIELQAEEDRIRFAHTEGA